MLLGGVGEETTRGATRCANAEAVILLRIVAPPLPKPPFIELGTPAVGLGFGNPAHFLLAALLGRPAGVLGGR